MSLSYMRVRNIMSNFTLVKDSLGHVRYSKVVAAFVRAAREKYYSHLSLEDFCKSIGMGVSEYQDKIIGNELFTSVDLISICQFGNTSVLDFMKGIEEALDAAEKEGLTVVRDMDRLSAYYANKRRGSLH